jgi:uncharacterized membrane protein YdbT with pleckstrin-like domain
VNPPGAIQPAAAAGLSNEQVIFEGRPALIPSLGALLVVILTVGLAAVYFYFKRGGTSYKVTTQRVVIDRGIFSKKMEQLDLYRINDFTVERPFGQRIMGTGNLRLVTFDKTTPIIELEGLKTNVVELYETMRKAVEKAQQGRGVRVVDYE